MFLRNPGIRAGVAAAFTIAWALLMSTLNRYPFPHIFSYDINSPVLALEFSHDAYDIDAVLHRSEPDKAPVAIHIMWLENALDLIFIPIYGFFLWSLARVFTDRTRLLTSLIVGTTLFDYLEDWQIFRALAGASPPIYPFSLVKWVLLGLALLLTAVVLLRTASLVYSLPTERLIAIGYLISGGLIVVAVALGQWIGYSYIEIALEIFGFLAIVHIIGLLGPHLAIAGISQKYVENFCEERKKTGRGSLVAVKPDRPT
ncbi:MAG: hypothetical protein WBY44_13490 [Bryobacteraceae bacterium]